MTYEEATAAHTAAYNKYVAARDAYRNSTGVHNAEEAAFLAAREEMLAASAAFDEAYAAEQAKAPEGPEHERDAGAFCYCSDTCPACLAEAEAAGEPATQAVLF